MSIIHCCILKRNLKIQSQLIQKRCDVISQNITSPPQRNRPSFEFYFPLLKVMEGALKMGFSNIRALWVIQSSPPTHCKVTHVWHPWDSRLSTLGPLVQSLRKASPCYKAVRFFGSSLHHNSFCFCWAKSSSGQLKPEVLMLISRGTLFFTETFQTLKQRSHVFPLPGKNIYRYSTLLLVALYWTWVLKIQGLELNQCLPGRALWNSYFPETEAHIPIM